jgi:hypothetical protein
MLLSPPIAAAFPDNGDGDDDDDDDMPPSVPDEEISFPKDPRPRFIVMVDRLVVIAIGE